MSWKTLTRTTPVTALLLLAACATTEVPPAGDDISDAAAAIERARQADAGQHAAFMLATAERKVDRARRLSDSEERSARLQALQLAQQASVDARLAESQARLAQTEGIHNDLQQTVDSLRRELGTGSGQTQ